MAICEAESISVTAGDREMAHSPGLLHNLPAAYFGPRDCADIMGVLIDRTSRERVFEQIAAFVESGRPHQIVTVNVDFLNIVHREHSFVRVLNTAAISVPDGMPLLWVSRLVGQALPQRITGTDLLLGSAELAARNGYRIFLLGAAPGVADHAARVLTERFPGIRVVGTCCPPEQGEFSAGENERIVQLVRDARPDMLFVALGTPKQEKWIHQNLEALGVPVCIGVGGVFNFITGRIPRAPEALQQAGLEWLFRLVLEPRRLWRRYLVDDTRALCRAMVYAARKRRNEAGRVGDNLARRSVVSGTSRPVDGGEWHRAPLEAAVPAAGVPAPDA